MLLAAGSVSRRDTESHPFVGRRSADPQIWRWTWLQTRCPFLLDDVVTERNALVADVDTRPTDQPVHLGLRLSAKRAPEGAVHPLRTSTAREHATSVSQRASRGHATIARSGCGAAQLTRSVTRSAHRSVPIVYPRGRTRPDRSGPPRPVVLGMGCHRTPPGCMDEPTGHKSSKPLLPRLLSLNVVSRASSDSTQIGSCRTSSSQRCFRRRG